MWPPIISMNDGNFWVWSLKVFHEASPQPPVVCLSLPINTKIPPNAQQSANAYEVLKYPMNKGIPIIEIIFGAGRASFCTQFSYSVVFVLYTIEHYGYE